jgi:DNA-binding Xre family transcriptional regulator
MRSLSPNSSQPKAPRHREGGEVVIRSESEYQEAIDRLKQDREHLRTEEERLRSIGLTRDEIKRALDPMQSFRAQLDEEVASYERLRRGQFDELLNFNGLGRMLVALRVYAGVSQRDLAERLGVHESQVSRDERNEYHGVTVERANRVLEALGVELCTLVKRAPLQTKRSA